MVNWNIFISTFFQTFQAGLRILNIDQDNFDLDEVAYFDVFPSGNTLTFSGSWSNYPYFESGKSG